MFRCDSGMSHSVEICEPFTRGILHCALKLLSQAPPFPGAYHTSMEGILAEVNWVQQSLSAKVEHDPDVSKQTTFGNISFGVFKPTTMRVRMSELQRCDQLRRRKYWQCSDVVN